MLSKQVLLEYCQTKLREREQEIILLIDQAKESLLKEQKSTAGDKHETSRALVQIEIDKHAKQLQQTQKLYKVLHLIAGSKKSDSIELGSVVKTSKGIYFLAVPLGSQKIENENVFFISLASPIGQALNGKKVGDSISFNGINQEVLDLA